MFLSAVSVLVVAQSSSEIPEGLMNNPVYIYIYMCVCVCVCVCVCARARARVCIHKMPHFTSIIVLKELHFEVLRLFLLFQIHMNHPYRTLSHFLRTHSAVLKLLHTDRHTNTFSVIAEFLRNCDSPVHTLCVLRVYEPSPYMVTLSVCYTAV